MRDNFQYQIVKNNNNYKYVIYGLKDNIKNFKYDSSVDEEVYNNKLSAEIEAFNMIRILDSSFELLKEIKNGD